MAARDSVERFTGKADVYARFRPGYPPGILDHLRTACGLAPSHVIADIGSGTGKLTELLLRNGNPVCAVEPNRELREAAERTLGGVKGFRSVDGRAEATGLPPASADMVTAGQAFHWFEPGAARVEFQRILRPGGWVVLVWNVRQRDASPFLAAYEGFLRDHSLEHEPPSHGGLTEGDGPRSFFTADYGTANFPNTRRLDFESVKGGYLSTSYSLPPDHPSFGAAMARLRALFDSHQEGGAVIMPLRAQVYHGRI